MTTALTVIYFLASVIAGSVAYDFYLSRDGTLRKILIQLFSVLSVRYAVYFMANVYTLTLAQRLLCGIILVPIEIAFLLRLWSYIKWRK